MTQRINVADFDLAATLGCGQAFRWTRQPDGWFVGVVGKEVWRVRQEGNVVVGNVGATFLSRPGPATRDRNVAPTTDLGRIRHYLALDVSLPAVVATFPDDPVLRDAVKQHWGLRVLRQEPWETLASFIASSTKQIVQIRQIVAELARRFGEPIANGHYSFPSVDVVARATHQQLWDCKLGFRAKYLLEAARMIDGGKIDWGAITAGATVGAASPPRPAGEIAAGTPLPPANVPPPRMDYDAALEELMKLPGVGEKIALCTLLFSCGFDQAFPIDVWVERSLRRLYFHNKKVTARELRAFTRTHFGPHAGWAQQYLFFSERSRGRQSLVDASAK